MYSTLSLEEKRKLRKQQQEKKREKKQELLTFRSEQIQHLNNKIQRIQSQCSKIENSLKTASSQIKKKLIQQLEDLKWNLSLLYVEKCNYDTEFTQRNSVKTRLCEKVYKGKECRYEDCWFAHSNDEIRIQKCVPHMFGCCTNGAMCKYDHSDTPLPEYPKRMEYSYSVTEEEKNELFNLFKPYFTEKITYYYPELVNQSELVDKLLQLEMKDIISVIISDKSFIAKLDSMVA